MIRVTCPHCGATLSATADRCSACNQATRPERQVAAGVLTPPGRSSSGDIDKAMLVGPDLMPLDPEVTRLGNIPPLGDDDVTRLGAGPEGSFPVGADSAETIFAPPAPVEQPAAARHAGATRGGRTDEGATGPLRVGQAFGDRYHIIRVLGIGGMGAVYHAWDAELGMAVALKVIRPESSSDPAAAREMERRFKQELVLARRVTHKNVVRIHDLGELDGIKYITMPHLEGSDLASVLKETGKMSLPAALGIVRDVAAGLVAAHEAGIVHRDLKPANIMVLEDRAVIMDFGIARSSKLPAESSAALAPADALGSRQAAVASTLVGTIVGTVQYMAPEQAKGLNVDQRADLYALGLILRDLLLGRRHTHDRSAFEDLEHRIEQAPPLVRTIDPTIPKAIEQVIAKCLQPDPAARFQTSAELVAELDRLDEKGEPIPIKRVVGLPLAAAVVAVLLAVSVGTWLYQRQFIPPAAHEPVSVVIADFENRTGDPALNRVLEPMLQRALADAGFITAFDRNTAARTLGAKLTATFDEGAARQLAVFQGFGVVLSGSLEPRRSGYRISVKATETVSERVITSGQADAATKDQVLVAATQLMARVRNALGDDTSESAQQFAMASLSATSLDVVTLYAGAQEAASGNRFEEARQKAAAAVERDPNFGIGYLLMAVASRNLGRLDDNRKYIDEALRHLDGMTERERYQTRGYSYWVAGDYQQCVKEYGGFDRPIPWRRRAATISARCVSRICGN